MTSPCRTIRRWLESYLDGELDPSQIFEVEQHALGCDTCRERVALNRSIRMGVRHLATENRPGAGFRGRVMASMAAERQKGTRPFLPAAVAPTRGGLFLAAAAGVAAVFAIQDHDFGVREIAGRDRTDSRQVASASVGLDTMLDQFVDWHARPLPPEITNAADLPGFEPYVGVPVRAPALSPFGARLLGGRILPVKDERVTAMLQYTMAGGRRISIYVYDPHRIQTSASRLHARVIGTEPIYVGRVRGWSIAAAEQRGVGYAVASDLNDEESAELVLAAAPH
jgi:anti-sigma factor RsiW